MAIYLKIKGIEGDLNAKSYEKAIEVFHYHLETGRSVELRVGTQQNRSIGSLSYGSLTLTKAVGGASTALAHYLYSGKTIASMEFHHVVTGNELKSTLIATFNEVMIQNIEETYSASQGVEEVTMYYLRREKRYIPMDATHSARGPQQVGYDFRTAEVV